MTIQTPTSWVTLIKNLQGAIRSIDQYVKQLIQSEYKERRKRFAAKLADDPAGGREFRAIRESPARPIQFLVDKEGTLHDEGWGRGLQWNRQVRRTGAPGLQSSLCPGHVQRGRAANHS